jgi:cell division protein ZapA
LKKRFDLVLLGQEVSVISDSGDEHVTEVIRYVSAKVDEARKHAGNRDALNIAILVALNIADEYLQVKGSKEDVYSQLENRSEQLIHLINDIR